MAEKKPHAYNSIPSERKALRRRAERVHGEDVPLHWDHGTLYFTETGLAVPDIRRVLKRPRFAPSYSTNQYHRR